MVRREITLEMRGFRSATALCSANRTMEEVIIKVTLVARSGNRFRLDSGLRENLWVSGKPTCSAMFPLITAERTSDVVIENLTLDGDLANNERLDGNYAGCIFLQDCNRFTIRGVTARRYNGDGISFQICHDVVVENCHCHDNADLGLHPGSGSQRPLLRNNHLERNDRLFWYGVKYGPWEEPDQRNRSYGISIGHHDTDNLMRDNDVADSGKVGILFRDESRGKDFWPNRNRVLANRIVNSGGEEGVAIEVQGKTRDIQIVGNQLRETRAPLRRTGLRVSAQAGTIKLADNRFEGFDKEVVDLPAWLRGRRPKPVVGLRVTPT